MQLLVRPSILLEYLPKVSCTIRHPDSLWVWDRNVRHLPDQATSNPPHLLGFPCCGPPNDMPSIPT
jgi:hypothetical protein